METAIIDAIKNGDVEGLKSLIDQSPDRDALLATKISIPNPTNHAIGKDATFLQLASMRDWKDAGIASTLLEYGVNVDLHSAAGLGQLDRIGELLSADSAGVDGQVDTYFPIQYAITALRPDSIQCLLQHGDDANRDLKKVAYFGWEDDTVDQTYTPWKPIHMASLWGFNASRVPVAECLADGGADLNAISPLDGYRPIHLVAMPNRVDMIRFYVERGVDVESRTGDGEMIQLATEERGSVDGDSDCTPLMLSAGEGFVEATECLLDLGADVNAEDGQGRTALHFAEKRFWNGQPYEEVIKLLKSRGAN